MAALRPGQAQTSAADAAIGTVEVAEPLGDSRVFVHIDPASFRTGNAQRDRPSVRSASSTPAGAVERHEPHGVWGGEIFNRGTIIAEKRPRGRPRRKAEAVI